MNEELKERALAERAKQVKEELLEARLQAIEQEILALREAVQRLISDLSRVPSTPDWSGLPATSGTTSGTIWLSSTTDTNPIFYE